MNAQAHEGRIEAKKKAALVPKPSDKPVTLLNPYKGQLTAMQMDESVDEFLKRVRVYGTDPREVQDSWIWIANFQSEPRNCDENAFKKQGELILEKFLENAALAVDQQTVKTTPLLKPQREKLKSDILDSARKFVMMTGKVSTLQLYCLT
jgi:hypothetical protein